MAEAEVSIELRRQDHVRFEATNQAGIQLTLDGPPAMGGQDAGMRPMELLLVALAGCAAMDVVHILTRQRQGLEDLRIRVRGLRSDAVPAVYETIHLHFEATGEVSPTKLERAVRLSVEKYCSVGSMLGNVEITHSASLLDPG